MKIFKLIIILSFLIFYQEIASQNNDCESILDKEIKLKEKNIYKSDLEVLKKCGYDFEKYEQNILAITISDIISKGEPLTYRNLTINTELIDSKFKIQMKNQIVLLIFKFCLFTIILVTIIYWLYVFFKRKKVKTEL